MSELPEFFLSVADVGDETGLVPLSYDAERRSFRVVDKLVAVDDFDPYGIDLFGLEIDDAGIDIRDIAEYPLYMTALPGRLLATPMFHRWAGLGQRGRQGGVQSAQRIIGSVYSRLTGQSGDVGGVDALGTHMGASAGLREAGGIHLQTIGGCACLGLDPGGLMVQGIQHGYGEYVLHNADARAQYVSLYAGIGHLAHLAAASGQ